MALEYLDPGGLFGRNESAGQRLPMPAKTGLGSVDGSSSSVLSPARTQTLRKGPATEP